MKKTAKPGIWLVLTSLTALIGAGGMYMQFGSLNEKGAEYKKLKTLARKPAEVEKELEETKTEVQAAQQRLDHLESAVPAFAYVPTLLKELRKRNPGLKIIFVSGYAEEAFAKNLPENDDRKQFSFLPKPFTLKQLVGAVKETMSA